MSQDKFFELQQQVRQNQTELNDYLKDFGSWSDDIKKKDDALKNQKPTEEQTQGLPPVRNSLDKKKRKKKPKQKEPAKEKTKPETKSKRINGYDYRAWDKFDVDKACEEDSHSSDASEYETDEEWEVQRKQQHANLLKDQGNTYFKEGRWDEAVECYTRGLESDPHNPLLSANRAMALLKQQKYGAAELDCTAAIALDPAYVKAYSRRGTARVGIQKYIEAREDFLKVLQLEPANKQAKTELQKIERVLNPPANVGSLDGVETGIVKAIHKPPHKRSKKPLRRIAIEEIGVEESEEQRRARQRAQEAPSNTGTKKLVTARDEAKFDEYFKAEEVAVSKRISPPESIVVTENSGPDVFLPKPPQAEPVSQENVKDPHHNVHTPHQNGTLPDEPSDSAATSPRVPGVPTSSFQFQADMKHMRKMSSDKFYLYLQEIPVTNYVKLFGQALEENMIVNILSTLVDEYMRHQKPVYPVLKHLASVKRFSMTYMFLSSQDKLMVKKLFAFMRSAGHEECSPADVDNLAKAYEL